MARRSSEIPRADAKICGDIVSGKKVETHASTMIARVVNTKPTAMMIPSRGLVSAASVARQAVKINRRFISTTPSRTLQSTLSQRSISSGLLSKSPSSSWRAGRIVPVSAIGLAAHSRLASTSVPPPNDAPAAAAAAAAGGPVDAAASDLTNSSFDISSISDSYLAAMPDRIGYLKEIGLDYGWGPTSMIEWGLEHIHVYSGLPWWGSIVVTALTFRLCLLPLFKRSSDMGARQQAMMGITKPLSEQMMAAFRANDTEKAAKLRAELKSINQRAGIKLSAMFTPALIQGVFGFCAFKLMRAMANLPVPGLEDGGLWWFSDLTQRDPYLALPAIMALSMHFVFRFGGESGAPMTNPAMKPILLYLMPGIIFISTLWMPACLNVWLATTGVTGIVQVMTFRNPNVRSALGMAPLTPTDPRNPQYSGVGRAAPTSNTIDVKGTSRPFSNNAASFQKGVRYQAPNINTKPLPNSLNDVVDQPQHLKQDFISRTADSLNSNVEDIRKGMSKFVGDYVARRNAGKNGPESKTKSKEFLKRAADYEARWKKMNEKE